MNLLLYPLTLIIQLTVPMLRTFLKTFRPTILIISKIYFRWISFIFWIFNLFVKRKTVRKPVDGRLLISALRAAEMIRNKKITSTSLLEAYITRIEEVNETINAVVEEDFHNARNKAKEVDDFIESLSENDEKYRELVKSKPLLGVPFTLKDCIEVDGLLCTVGISYRKNVRADKDAIVIQRMKEAGAIPLAITNVPEVCLWWESMNSIHGRSCNPYDSRRITGGSSGGEAALISAAGSVIGIGSDIGGSIRMPANFNGIFGLKPSPGVVPLTGHLPEPEGNRILMLRIGPMCRYAEDLNIMLKVMAGEQAVQKLNLNAEISLKKIRVFYMEGLKTPLARSLSGDCYEALKRAVRYFENKYDLCGIRLDLPFAHYAVEFFLMSMEVPDAPKFAEHMADLKFEVNCMVELIKWLFCSSQHTLPALVTGLIDKKSVFNDQQRKLLLSQRDRLERELTELLRDDGILIFPSFPTIAPFHHEPLLTPLNFAYTALWNTLPFPVIQCPMGLNKDGIPVGIQVVGGRNADRMLIAIAEELENGFGGWRPASDDID